MTTSIRSVLEEQADWVVGLLLHTKVSVTAETEYVNLFHVCIRFDVAMVNGMSSIWG
jgi:hypothetical protein